MMENIFDIQDFSKRMDGAVSSLKNEFSGLRTGRASASLLDPISVDIYGSKMPINQLGTVSVPDPRTIAIQVWDKSQVDIVDKSIRDSGLGLNPSTDGQLIRIPIPELNSERREELSRVASKYSENARVAVRNVRRDGMDTLKKLEKNNDISQDDHKIYSNDIQKLTDSSIKIIDETLQKKTSEIMSV
jgi:ribosome recycling factor